MKTDRSFGGDPKSLGRAVRVLIIGAILAVALVGSGIPFVRYVDDQLIAYRFAAAPRSATGRIVYLAIDKATLDQVGTWPWPRSVYASILQRLNDAGVEDVFLDIDFSTPSTPSQDAQLAHALEAAGGGVILPVFEQHASVDNGAASTVTTPMRLIADNSWLAFANILPDDDGLIRRFELQRALDGHPTQSAPVVLSRSQVSGDPSLIDYSIRPSTVPVVSVRDILDPAFDLSRLHQRSVIVGAYATELKDIFPVPVYGQLTGPMLHALATETILQDRLLREPDQRPFELAFAALVVAGALGMRGWRTKSTAIAVLLLVVGGEIAAYMLQKHAGVVIRTASGWIMVVLALVLLLTEKLDLSQLIAEAANAEERNIRRLLRKIVADSTDGVLAFDHHLVIFEDSGSARKMLAIAGPGRGRSLSDVLPASVYQLVKDLEVAYGHNPQAIHTQTGRFDVGSGDAARHLDATITLSPAERSRGIGDGLQNAFIGSLLIRDVTARHRYEERLKYLADHDALTGLMNRNAFASAIAPMDHIHVVAIGIHRLSVVNATMGREVGDDLLKAVAKRLAHDGQCVASGRLGGDVFAAAVPGPQTTTAEHCATRMTALFDEPFRVGGRAIEISVRVGVVHKAGSDLTGSAVIDRAEHALDQASSLAGNGWRIYDPATAAEQQRSRELEAAMRESLRRQEFFLLYQPQVDLRSGVMVGAEALLRWSHPDFGLVSPATFIPLAEANGFICELGQWVIEKACQDAIAWPADLRVSVNVASVQLLRTDVVAQVKNALTQTGLPPTRLHLEITESGFVENSARVIAALSDLRALGISIAVDDFGTGFSSLSYMAGLPLDVIKIDQSFIRKMAADEKSLAIVTSIKALAAGLNLTVVAEGVESKIEADILRTIGCEVAQGYFYAKPQPAETLQALLQSPPWDHAA